VKRAIAVVAFVAATILATGALAGARDAGAPLASSAGAPKKQPEVLGFYQGRTVKYFDFGPIKLKRGNKIAPIWTFSNGADGQRNIIDTVPGRAGYSPLWQVNKVTWASGPTPRVLRSAAEVQQAVAAGEATVERTQTVVNCPVLGFGQVRHPGFSRGKTIHYYDLGKVRVAAGNEVLPLWAFTNGAKGQRNVADVTPGQTAYPPLWSIVQVTWKAGVKPRVLRSYAQIRRARAAGLLRLRKTSTVVNCPLV
jgi:hypothetical protein